MAPVLALPRMTFAETGDIDPQSPAPQTFHGTTEVVASRVSDDPAEAGRREVLLTRDEIAALPATTLQEVLALLPGVGLSRRCARGVQGDLNLRGSTFEIDVDPSRSAYALAHPALEASWTGGLDAGRGWTLGWAARHRRREDGGSWTVLDLRLGRRILDQLTISLEASNVFDREITELHRVPLPGRWASLTLGWRPEPSR
jgi:outer membrane receptor protein involved in Fe transport